MKSPLLRVSGEGEVNLRASSMNYLLKATVVDTSRGQMGAERRLTSPSPLTLSNGDFIDRSLLEAMP